MQMNTNLTIVNSLDEKIWREFINQHPQSNIFHTPEMFEVFERAHSHHPQIYAALDDNRQVQVLFLPVQVTLKNGLLRRLTSRSIAYGGVLCSCTEEGKKALGKLLVEYSKGAGRETIFTELRNLGDQSAIQLVLEGCRFSYEDHLDYLIDLDCSSEQLMQNIGSRTRKHIRQALRKGNIVVDEIVDRSQIAIWYGLVHRSYLTARVPLADQSLFESAYDVLNPRGMIKFWLARIGDIFVAASVELLYKDKIYGWYGGVDRTYAKEMPGEVLMWYILEWGVLHGYKIYDFGGAGKPGEAYGVRDFKAKFGGNLVNYGRNTLVHSPILLRVSESGYQFYRQLLRQFYASPLRNKY
jgi:lipid II:glycine glycyltransferase (peptidoglycan interpeptide bridge formation enzyme)